MRFLNVMQTRTATFLLLPLLIFWAASETTLTYPRVFSSPAGGSGYDEARDVTLDPNGNIYLVGGTRSGLPGSTPFPTTPGVIQPLHNQADNPDGVQNMDMFITKLSPDGKIIWSTLLGGPCYDKAYAVEVDPWGYVYVAGRAGCDFPTITQGTFQPNFMGGWNNLYGNQDGIVIKLSPDASQVIWSSYFGTSEANALRDIDLDLSGNVYVIGGYQPGSTVSAAIASGLNLGYRSTPYGSEDALVAKISPDGKQILWASYLGGSGFEQNSNSLRVAPDRSVYAMTTSESQNAPVVNAYDPSYNGGKDTYLVRIAPDGKQLLFATYIGGSGDDFAAGTHNLWLDLAGNPIVSGSTRSQDYPVSKTAFQPNFRGGNTGDPNLDGDLFVTKISSDGKQLLASTYLGGSKADNNAEGIATDYYGNIVITGQSSSTDFPLTAGAQALGSEQDNVLVILKDDLSGLIYSSFTAGAGLRSLDSAGLAIVGAGMTASPGWPTLGAFQSYQGATDATILKLAVQGGTLYRVGLPLVKKGR